MGEVREENQRLKMCLNKIMTEYRALEMQFNNMVKQETKKNNVDHNDNNHEEMNAESDFVSLSLGRVPSNNIPKNDQEKVNKVSKLALNNDEEFNKEELSLGLECKFETSKSGSTTEGLPNIPSPVNSSEVVPIKDDEVVETWPPSKTLNKTMRDAEDEVAQQTPAKKARVCVRARCDTPTVNTSQSPPFILYQNGCYMVQSVVDH